MSKDKKNNGGIDKIKETGASEVVKKISKVDSVDEVAPITKVGGVKQAGGVSGARISREMTTQEREKLFRIVDEEADKLFTGSTSIGAKRKKLVQEAVKMAIDSGLLEKPDSGTKE
jgi:hypothetical protein